MAKIIINMLDELEGGNKMIEKIGRNCIIGDHAELGENVELGHNCIIEDGAVLADNVVIDNNVIVRKGAIIGKDSFIGANCIIGEKQITACNTKKEVSSKLTIGEHALIRSGSIVYENSLIGDYFQTGHQVTIREETQIGNHVSIGTLSDIQGHCVIGNYVNMHSNVHIGQKSQIDDYVWIFPYVVLTNDPTPPSEYLQGVHICSFAVVATSAVILPGIQVDEDSMVAAGAVVTKDVKKFEVVGGNPAKKISDIRTIKNKITGENAYPWRYHFSRRMPWEDIGYMEWANSCNVAEMDETTLF